MKNKKYFKIVQKRLLILYVIEKMKRKVGVICKKTYWHYIDNTEDSK